MKAITYEITATVREDLCSAFEAYMIERHIPDLMATDAFSEATFSRSGSTSYRTRYQALSREALDEYFRVHAPRLRGEMAQSFPEGAEFEREEWEILASF